LRLRYQSVGLPHPLREPTRNETARCVGLFEAVEKPVAGTGSEYVQTRGFVEYDGRRIRLLARSPISYGLWDSVIIVTVSDPFLDASELWVIKGSQSDREFWPDVQATGGFGDLLIKGRLASPSGLMEESFYLSRLHYLLCHVSCGVPPLAAPGQQENPKIERIGDGAPLDGNVSVQHGCNHLRCHPLVHFPGHLENIRKVGIG
jgi:hypothetical protein